MPCPHNEITIVQCSQRQSAVAAAAYQSGEKLFCEYGQQVKRCPEKDDKDSTQKGLQQEQEKLVSEIAELRGSISSKDLLMNPVYTGAIASQKGITVSKSARLGKRIRRTGS